jgi:hypothetical protein
MGGSVNVAWPSKANIRLQRNIGRDGPEADNVRRNKMILFDHLVGGDTQTLRHGEAQRFRRP